MYFSWATDLDPKGVNSQIKEAMLSPGQGEDESLVTQSGKMRILYAPYMIRDKRNIKG